MGDGSVLDVRSPGSVHWGGPERHGLHLQPVLVWPGLPRVYPASGTDLAAGGPGVFSHRPTLGCVSVRTQRKSGRQEEAVPCRDTGDQPSVFLTLVPTPMSALRNQLSCFCTGTPLPPTVDPLCSKVLLQVWPAPPASPGNVLEMDPSAPDPRPTESKTLEWGLSQALLMQTQC